MSKALQRITGTESLKRYFNSEYIGAYSLDDGAEPILTIDSLWFGEVTLAGGRKEPHVVVRFKEKKVPGVDEVKPLILNATNRKMLKKLYGSDSASVLEGKRIQLYIDPKVRDPEDGGFTEGLRIRKFIPKPTGTAKCTNPDCGKEITAAGKLTAAEVVAYSSKNYGTPLCADCMTMIKKAKEEAEKEEVTANESDT